MQWYVKDSWTPHMSNPRRDTLGRPFHRIAAGCCIVRLVLLPSTTCDLVVYIARDQDKMGDDAASSTPGRPTCLVVRPCLGTTLNLLLSFSAFRLSSPLLSVAVAHKHKGPLHHLAIIGPLSSPICNTKLGITNNVFLDELWFSGRELQEHKV